MNLCLSITKATYKKGSFIKKGLWGRKQWLVIPLKFGVTGSDRIETDWRKSPAVSYDYKPPEADFQYEAFIILEQIFIHKH